MNIFSKNGKPTWKEDESQALADAAIWISANSNLSIKEFQAKSRINRFENFLREQYPSYAKAIASGNENQIRAVRALIK